VDDGGGLACAARLPRVLEAGVDGKLEPWCCSCRCRFERGPRLEEVVFSMLCYAMLCSMERRPTLGYALTCH